MLEGIFDTHTHYDNEQFDFIRHAILHGMEERGVSMILNCGGNVASSEFSAELASQYPFLYSAAGIHPHSSSYTDDDWSQKIAGLLERKKVVAIGEIGLDYHYNFSDRASQRQVFGESLALAVQLGFPVIVHDRDAHDDILAMLREYRPKGVVHRFSGSPEMAAQLLELDLMLGFGCSITYNNAVFERETLRIIPFDSLLLETDCPYLAPSELRHELCTSDMISFAAEEIARLRPECTSQRIVDIARENGIRLFGIETALD